MPPRSNRFQRLILAIERSIKGPATVVAESASFPDPVTGEDREIDVVIISKVGRHAAVVAVEIRDRKRPADVIWIDELIAKYQNTGFKVVAVSNSGFTKTALVKARGVGIRALSLEDADQQDWPEILRDQRFTVSMAVTSNFQFRPIISVSYAGSWVTQASVREYAEAEILDSKGRTHPLPEVIAELMEQIDFAEKAFQGLIDPEGNVTVSFDLPAGTMITKSGEVPIPVMSLEVRANAKVTNPTAFELTGSRFDGEFVAHGSADSSNYEIQVVATSDNPNESVITFSVFHKDQSGSAG